MPQNAKTPMPAPAWVFFNADLQPLQGSCVAAFQCGHGRIQNHGQQDAQQYINAAVLLEQDRGRDDGNRVTELNTWMEGQTLRGVSVA